jgi:hypothetical protein
MILVRQGGSEFNVVFNVTRRDPGSGIHGSLTPVVAKPPTWRATYRGRQSNGLSPAPTHGRSRSRTLLRSRLK